MSFMNMNAVHQNCARNAACMADLSGVELRRWTRNIFFNAWRIQTMPGVKRKRTTKAVPVLGAAGLTFSLVGGASAAVAPVTDVSQTQNIAPSHEFTLGVEELSDVSLATFYAFDKENTGSLRGMVQEARGCGGCRGCGGRGCRGCRGCGGGCGGGCGCGGGGCCLSWGGCRLC
jgi:hypothetical protein